MALPPDWHHWVSSTGIDVGLDTCFQHFALQTMLHVAQMVDMVMYAPDLLANDLPDEKHPCHSFDSQVIAVREAVDHTHRL